MSDMDWRAWIKVPGLDIEGEDAERLLVELERSHGDMGPVLGGTRVGVDVVLSVDRPTESDAAQAMFDAVCDSLRTVGLGNLYAVSLEMEPSDDLVAA